MKFLKILFFVVALRLRVCRSLTSKILPNTGSSWYIPSTPSAIVRSDVGDSYYNYNTVSSQPVSSLTPTNSFGTPQASLYPQVQYDESQKNNFYSGGLYNSESDSSMQYPYGSKPEDNVDQRQDFIDGPFGGIASTASNIAQGVGLGGLGIAGSLIVLAVGGPLLALAVLFPVAILIVAILGFPVLKLTLPATDPNLSRMFKSSMKDVASRALESIQSEECLERISCVIAAKAKSLPYEDWILEKMSTSGKPWTARVTKSVKAARSGVKCDSFICSPATKASDFYRALKKTKGQ